MIFHNIDIKMTSCERYLIIMLPKTTRLDIKIETAMSRYNYVAIRDVICERFFLSRIAAYHNPIPQDCVPSIQ